MPNIPTYESGELSENHWIVESFAQRMTKAQWRQVLLNQADRIWFRGELRHLVAKSLGSGIVEVTKAPLNRQEGICPTTRSLRR